MARKVCVVNETSCRCVGVQLLKAVYAAAYRLYATDVVINKVRYNKWAEVELYERGNCIDRHYSVNVKEETI